MDLSHLVIKLCRHGESMQNTGEADVRNIGDYRISLTEKGHQQAFATGVSNGEFLRRPDTLFYRSSFLRVRQTIDGVLKGARLLGPDGAPLVKIYEDPRLREVDHGYSSVEEQEALRKIHGWFYYRFNGGESPADCYDRGDQFIDSMMRQAQRKEARQIFIGTHGLTARLLVMRFLHLTVEQFESMANPHNCDVITIAKVAKLTDPQFVNGRWGVEGIRIRA